ncbi:hypothetical protein EPN90_00045, partial [Patescibacteria group bacterium]
MILFVISSWLLAINPANAATTIGLNISTDGTLTVVGASSFQGGATFTDGTLVDLSSIQPTASTNEGLKLPQASGVFGNPTTGEGYLAWRTDSNQLQVFDGSSWVTVSGGSVSFSGNIFPNSNNVYDNGVATSSWRNLYVSSSAYFGGALIPNPNNSVNLGAATSSFRNLYVSSTAYLGGGLQTGSDLRPNANNAIDLGYATSSFRNLYVSSTSYISGASSTGGLYPTANNLYDIGGYTRAWKDIYASGTAYLGSLNLSGALTQSGHLIPGANNTYDLGASTSSWRNL